MAKHKLYRQFENASPLTSSLCREVSPVRDVHPSTSDAVALVRRTMVKSVKNEKSGNVERVINENINLNFSEPLPGGNCASDSDSDEFFGNSSKTGAKLPYSAKEDEWILKFVLKGQNVFKVGSLSLWRHLESKKENPKRTYQSLKNRFLRSIRPHIFTRYGHLITSATEIERILAKFPELKCKVGRTNTLSRIQLPARKPNTKSAESGFVNGSLDDDDDDDDDRVASHGGPARRERISNVHDFSKFERKVTIRGKSLAVSVNFNSKELHKAVIPSPGIYETYNKFRKKNKLILCSACGRYNQPNKNKLAQSSGDEKSLNFGARGHDLSAGSLTADPGKSSATNSRSPPAKHRKVEEWELRPYGPSSPSSPTLMRGAGEEHGTPVGWGTEEPPEAGGADGAPETAGAVALRREADSAAADRLRETDDDIDSTYDVTVTDFKKLIKNEEERLLVKRCLYGKAGILGLSDSISQMSMESYFVELSPNLQTPELTIDYSSRSPTNTSERDNSSSLLARNMMKMLEEKKTSKEL